MRKIFARRDVLLALGGALAVVASAAPQARGHIASWRDPSPGVFRHPDSARRVGAAYLRERPHEADAERLRALLVESLPLPDRKMAGPAARRAFAAAQRQDFADRRTVLVQGWLLSQTEARLCALAALA